MTVTRTKIHRKVVLALMSLAIAFAAMAPSGKAALLDFSFQPGAFSKAHKPLQHEMQGFCPGFFQCIVFAQSTWVQPFEEAPEETQAGGRPDFTTNFRFPVLVGANDVASRPKTVVEDLPAGSVGNPLAVKRCEMAEFQLTLTGACTPAAQVGTALTNTILLGEINFYAPVSSLVPSAGQPGLLAFKAFGLVAMLIPEARSDGDYGLRVTAQEIPALVAPYAGSTINLWGVPYDPVHDQHRFNDSGGLGGHAEGIAETVSECADKLQQRSEHGCDKGAEMGAARTVGGNKQHRGRADGLRGSPLRTEHLGTAEHQRCGLGEWPGGRRQHTPERRLRTHPGYPAGRRRNVGKRGIRL